MLWRRNLGGNELIHLLFGFVQARRGPNLLLEKTKILGVLKSAHLLIQIEHEPSSLLVVVWMHLGHIMWLILVLILVVRLLNKVGRNWQVSWLLLLVMITLVLIGIQFVSRSFLTDHIFVSFWGSQNQLFY